METNKERKYCVYMHVNKVNNKVYVGQTCNLSKRWSNNGAKYLERVNDKYKHPRFGPALAKYGWDGFDHIIVVRNITKQEADNKEKELIAFYNTTDKQYGYNCTTGGDGWIPNEDQRKRSSEAAKLRFKNKENHPRYGVLHTEESKKKMSASTKGENHPNWGKHLSQQTRNKISSSQLGKPKDACAKSVYCIDLDVVFKSEKQIREELHMNPSHVGSVCRGKRKTAGGYRWLYVYDYTDKDNNIIYGAISLGYITEDNINEKSINF